MRFTILLTAVSAAALSASPAFAQDFTGPRVEVNAGYDNTHADDGIAATPNKLEAVRVGGMIGYDKEIGSTLVIGAEAGIGFNVEGDAKGSFGTTTAKLTAGYDFDASLRVGAKVGKKTLVYAKGGYVNSEFTAVTSIGGVAGMTTTKFTDDEDGWRIGAGVEHKLTDRIFAKAEYRYTDYGNDVSRHQALVGLGYRF